MDFSEEVQEVSIQHRLNRSQTRALEKLRAASEQEFQRLSFTASWQNTLFTLTTSLFTPISFEQKWVRKNTYEIWFKISIRNVWPPPPCLGRYQGQGGCNQKVLSRKVRSTNWEPRHFHSSKHRLKTVLQSLQRVVWVMIALCWNWSLAFVNHKMWWLPFFNSARNRQGRPSHWGGKAPKPSCLGRAMFSLRYPYPGIVDRTVAKPFITYRFSACHLNPWPSPMSLTGMSINYHHYEA